MRAYLVNQLVRLTQFLTTSDAVSRRRTMDQILLTHEWGD